jgi:hypothetical protein
MKKLRKAVCILLCAAVAAAVFPYGVFAADDLFPNAETAVFNQTVSGELTKEQTRRYYKLELSESGCVTVEVKTELWREYCELLDASGSAMESYYVDHYEGDRYRETRSFDLLAGTYYWYIKNNTGNYELKIDFQPSGETVPESMDERFNNPDTAKPISFGQACKGQLAINDSIDYYKFSVPCVGVVSVEVTTVLWREYCALQDDSGKTVDSYYVSGTDGDRYKETHSWVLEGGTYFWYIRNNTGNYDFRFDFSLLPGDPDGDGTVTASDARLALRTAVSLENFAPGSLQFNACDVDGDGTVTAADARGILRAAVGLEKLR